MEKSNSSLFNKIIEVAVGIGAISFLFYYAGFVRDVTCLSILGIIKSFVSVSYEQNVLYGVIVFMPFLLFLPLFLRWFLSYRALIKYEKNVNELSREINETSFITESEKKIKTRLENTLKKKYKEIEEIKKEYKTINPFRSSWLWLMLVLMLLTGFIMYVFVFKKPFQILLTLEVILAGIISLIIYDFIRKIILDINRNKNLTYLLMIVFLVFLIFPILSSGVGTYINIKENNFKKVEVKTNTESISNVDFIMFREGVYIFRNNNEYIYTPESQIIKITDGDSAGYSTRN